MMATGDMCWIAVLVQADTVSDDEEVSQSVTPEWAQWKGDWT